MRQDVTESCRGLYIFTQVRMFGLSHIALALQHVPVSSSGNVCYISRKQALSVSYNLKLSGMVLWCQRTIHRPTIYKAISKSGQIREFVIEQHYSWGRSKDRNVLCCCKCITTTFICSITNSRIWLWQRSNEALLYYKNQAFLVCTVLYKPVYIMLAWFCWAYNRLTRNR